MKTDGTTPTSSGASPQQTAAGISRRQIVRAGLSAAPVVAVLKSNSVLAAGNAIVPSAFASLQANKGSISPSSYRSNIQVRTPADWVSKTSNLKKEKFLDCGFVGSPIPKYGREVTLEQVLTNDKKGREAVLARYVVASYLTAREFGNNRDVLALTTSQCNEIWNQKGKWKPFAGAEWKSPQTMAYFETIYGIRG